MKNKQLLICGATGFIGRNLVEHYAKHWEGPVVGTYLKTSPPALLKKNKKIKWVKVDLRNHAAVKKVVKGSAIVIQAAATTSGAKDIVSRPYIHVTDNAVMNSLILRECFEQKIEQLVFFSCTTMYQPSTTPVKESDFNSKIEDKYFGVGWTKLYIEKMCEFFSRISHTKFTVIRHSNIYGPYDKYDLDRSHVFGASMTKILTNRDGHLEVWGDGSDERDLLHVDDLLSFVDCALRKQKNRFELLNVGLGRSVTVETLVKKMIAASGKKIKVHFNTSKPSLNYKLVVDIRNAKTIFGWEPVIDLETGIQKTMAWYRQNILKKSSV